MKPWQMGYELDYLKGIHMPFKTQHKPLVFGAFGLVKERDVATALLEGRCIFDRARTSCIIWKHLKRGSVKKDFAGEEFRLPPASHIITHFATTDYGQGKKLLQMLLDAFLFRSTCRHVFIDIFEEDATVKKIVTEKGFRWQSSKVTAGSEIIGTYKISEEEAKVDEKELASLCDIDVLGYFKTEITPEELEQIRSEIDTIRPFAQHYSHYNKRHSWTAFALKGYKKDDPEFIIKPAEMSKKWKAENADLLRNIPEWTNVAGHFKKTIEIAKSFGRFDRVRFMKLEAGGELSRHADITDREAGVKKGKVMRVHIPIYTNENVTFYAWDIRGERITKVLEEGKVYYLDQRKPHRVTNRSDKERVHLVIDVIA